MEIEAPISLEPHSAIATSSPPARLLDQMTGQSTKRSGPNDQVIQAPGAFRKSLGHGFRG